MTPYLLLDEGGRIISEWNTGSLRFRSILDAIYYAGGVLKLFDEKGIVDLNEADYTKGPAVFLTTQDRLGLHELENSFLTKLPVARLLVGQAGKNRFLATFGFTAAYTEIQTMADAAWLWIGTETGRIEGVSATLVNNPVPGTQNRYKIIGRPVSELLNPTPARMAEESLSASPCPDESAFVTKGTTGNCFARMVGLQGAPEIIRQREGETLVWENRGRRIDFAPLDFSFLPFEEQFQFTTEFEVEKGDWPLLIAGRQDAPMTYPDYHGFSIGLSVDHKTVILKKNADPIADTGPKALDIKPLMRVRFLVCGRNIRFRSQSGIKLDYCDLGTPEKGRLSAWLGLRPGSRVRFRTLELAGREIRSPVPDAPVVSLHGDPVRYCTLHHLAGRQTGRIGVYLLHDVTLFEKERRRLSVLAGVESGTEGAFLGKGAGLLKMKENARAAALSGAAILIQGETGSGKEVMARYIHRHSPYSQGPFVKVDCSTLSPTLIESELFGHEKGAFTGAVEQRKGRIEEADRGLLFLDEIGNLGSSVQAKLLQFLQDLSVTRVGGTKTIRLALQVAAASNIPLEQLVRQGTFRKDLYFRLNVFAFSLPPLRERATDLPDLCDHFIRLFSEQYGKNVRGLSGEAYGLLAQYPWPGNVRELRNALQRAVVYCDGRLLEPGHFNLSAALEEDGLPPAVATAGKRPANRRTRRPAGAKIEKGTFESLAAKAKGNVNRISKDLEVSRLTVYRLFEKFGLRPERFRA